MLNKPDCRLHSALLRFTRRLLAVVLLMNGAAPVVAEELGEPNEDRAEQRVLEIDSIRRSQLITSAAFSPDGLHLAIGRGEALEVYTLPTQQLMISDRQKTTRWLRDGFENRLRSLAYSPDGKVLAAGRGDGRIVIYDTSNYERLAVLTHSLERLQPFNNWPAVTQVIFTPDGTKLISTGGDERIVHWDAKSWQNVRAVDTEGTFMRLAITSAGNEMAGLTRGGKLVVFQMANPQKPRTIQDRHVANSVAFSHDGKLLFAIVKEGVRIWEVASGSVVKTIDAEHLIGVHAMANGSELCVINQSSVIQFYNLRTFELLRTLGKERVKEMGKSSEGIPTNNSSTSYFAVAPSETLIVTGNKQLIFTRLENL